MYFKITLHTIPRGINEGKLGNGNRRGEENYKSYSQNLSRGGLKSRCNTYDFKLMENSLQVMYHLPLKLG